MSARRFEVTDRGGRVTVRYVSISPAAAFPSR